MAVQILNAIGADFEPATSSATTSSASRSSVYSDWPTIPQLYVDGEFVGGSDIMRRVHVPGRLASA